jgi:RecB family exonuclease
VEGAQTRALSPTQASTYLDCPARWYYRYALGLPDEAGTALAVGKAVHRGIVAAIGARAYDGDPQELAECVAAIAQEELSQAKLEEDESSIQLTNQISNLVKLYAAESLPAIDVARVEVPVAGEIGGIPVHGIVDLITTAGQVIDIKTAAKSPSGLRASHQLQLTTYGMLLRAASTRLDTLTKTKTPKLIQQTFEIEESDRQYARTVYSFVADCIASGVHPPHRDANLCSRKHCAYWQQCCEEHGGRIQ